MKQPRWGDPCRGQATLDAAAATKALCCNFGGFKSVTGTIADRTADRRRWRVVAVEANGDAAKRFCGLKLAGVARQLSTALPDRWAGVGRAGLGLPHNGADTDCGLAARRYAVLPRVSGPANCLGKRGAIPTPLVFGRHADAKRGTARHPTFGLWPVACATICVLPLQGGFAPRS